MVEVFWNIFAILGMFCFLSAVAVAVLMLLERFVSYLHDRRKNVR